MPLFLRFFHSVRPATMPDRIVCNSPNRRWASEGGTHGEGLNNSQYSRMCDASTPSVLLRPNLVRTKSRIWAGLMTDNMVGLVQRTRDAETITPGGFQTGVNPLDLLGNQPIQEMAPPIRRIREAPGAHLGVT